MTLKDYTKKRYEKGIWSMEILTIIYILFTTVLILFHWQGLSNPTSMIITRVVMLGVIGACYGDRKSVV